MPELLSNIRQVVISLSSPHQAVLVVVTTFFTAWIFEAISDWLN